MLEPNKEEVAIALSRYWYMNLKFNNSTYPIMLDMIKNVKNDYLVIDLSSTYIRNVSALGKVHTLNLSHTYVRDVSALGNVHKLLLERCQGVKDVSALGKVHSLSLALCRNIKDVSMLNNVRRLMLPHNV